jgi:hypothetical protein
MFGDERYAPQATVQCVHCGRRYRGGRGRLSYCDECRKLWKAEDVDAAREREREIRRQTAEQRHAEALADKNRHWFNITTNEWFKSDGKRLIKVSDPTKVQP